VKVCDNCGHLIRDGGLACRACIEREAFEQAQRAQLEFMPAVARGRLQLHIARRFNGAVNGHIALFGYRHQSYCGENIGDLYRSRAELTGELRKSLCPKCLKKLDELLTPPQCSTTA
jgi:hypothetical protein